MDKKTKTVVLTISLIALLLAIIGVLSAVIINRPRHTITLYDQGGIAILDEMHTPKSYLYQNDLTLPASDSLEFDHWVYRDSKKEVFFPIKVTGNLSLEVRWKGRVIFDDVFVTSVVLNTDHSQQIKINKVQRGAMLQDIVPQELAEVVWYRLDTSGFVQVSYQYQIQKKTELYSAKFVNEAI